MTLDEFVNTYNGTQVGDGQCVYLIRYYIEQVLNLEWQAVGNAHQFYDDYETNEYLKTNFNRYSVSEITPQKRRYSSLEYSRGWRSRSYSNSISRYY